MGCKAEHSIIDLTVEEPDSQRPYTPSDDDEVTEVPLPARATLEMPAAIPPEPAAPRTRRTRRLRDSGDVESSTPASRRLVFDVLFSNLDNQLDTIYEDVTNCQDNVSRALDTAICDFREELAIVKRRCMAWPYPNWEEDDNGNLTPDI